LVSGVIFVNRKSTDHVALLSPTHLPGTETYIEIGGDKLILFLANVLYVLLQFTASDYPFGIFKLFY
jgi:hypothetical protein